MHVAPCIYVSGSVERVGIWLVLAGHHLSFKQNPETCTCTWYFRWVPPKGYQVPPAILSEHKAAVLQLPI